MLGGLLIAFKGAGAVEKFGSSIKNLTKSLTQGGLKGGLSIATVAIGTFTTALSTAIAIYQKWRSEREEALDSAAKRMAEIAESNATLTALMQQYQALGDKQDWGDTELASAKDGKAFIANDGKPTIVDLEPGAAVLTADETKETLKGRKSGTIRAFCKRYRLCRLA